MSGVLRAWVTLVTRHPMVVLLGLGVLTLLLGSFVSQRFSVDTEMSNLIRQEAPWRDDYERYKDTFPEMHDTALVVVSGQSLEMVERSTEALQRALRAHQGIGDVFAPLADDFFDEHALLFLTLDELEALVDRLAAAQPLLTAVAEGRGLTGMLDVISLAIRNQEIDALEPLLEPLAQSAESIIAGEEEEEISWRDQLFTEDGTATHYSIISLSKPVNTGQRVRDSAFVADIREVIQATRLARGTEARITGAIPLSHEEVVAAQEGVRIAGIISAVLLAIILYVGVRSLRIIMATGVMLAVGVVWTAAWGLVAVGQFNPLSLIFAVVFFGLGVDFAIHYSLRYQEALREHAMPAEALADAAGTVGSAILLCAVTTAIGFLAFVPTAYQGVSQLGIIAAGGMVVAAALTLTLLPAMLVCMGRLKPLQANVPRTAALTSRLLAARGIVLGFTGVLALLALLLLPRIGFDHSVLALKNPDAESMRVLRELQREGVANDYTVTVMLREETDIAPLVAQLEALDEVDRVETPFDHVPDNQEDKLFLLEDIGMMLGDALFPSTGNGDTDYGPDALQESIDSLLGDIAAAPAFGEPEDGSLHRLADAMTTLREAGLDALYQWEAAVTPSLERELDWLRRALQSDPITFDDLPAPLRRRLQSRDGTWRLAVLPAADVGDTEALTRYVEAVRGIVPDATGRPVLEWGLGGLVSQAFIQALGLALVAVTLVLTIALRNLRDIAMVLLPLSLAALFTVAVQVLFGLSLNMANILVLPLIFGLGVGNGIHMVQRYRSGQQLGAVLSSSTPRAVLLSALTTIGAFAALSLSPHYGIASIGILLTIAVSLLLLTVIFLLPVFLATFGRQGNH